ncbi:MAG: AAA-like domain-containing protein [Nostocaceae cyanobacterium]|nr:AAA-like domain-containing protein [Nostocaceae cyanobacterium]
MKILIIEHDNQIATTITEAFEKQSYNIDIAASAASGLNLATARNYNLILIDLSVPSDEGIKLYQRLRIQNKETPILLIVPQNTKNSLLEILDAKADDYLLKPFAIDELIFRTQVLLRTAKSQIPTSILSWGDLQLDQASAKVTYQNRQVYITRKEYQLLELFLLHPREVFSRTSIIPHLWSSDESPTEAAVTNLMKNLRHKFKLAGIDTDPIETVYGIGYRLKTIEQKSMCDSQCAENKPLTMELQASTQPITKYLEFVNRPEAANSRFYIPRPPIEELVLSEIRNPGSLIRITAPRKMGKSSLLNQLLADAQTEGYQTVTIDFQQAEESIFRSLDKFLRWLCALVSHQLHLSCQINDYWSKEIGSKVSCTIYFESYILPQIDKGLLLAFNEVNRVLEHPQIAQDFLPLLRYWYEIAQPNEPWGKLRKVVINSSEIDVQLPINQSPFNIGLSIQLPEFNTEQIQRLAQLHSLDWQSYQNAEKLKAMVGGHPYLVRIALFYISRGEITLENLLQSAPTALGVYQHYLRNLWGILQSQPQLLTAIKQVLANQENLQLDPVIVYKLESLGLINLDRNQPVIACQLYQLFLESQLANLGFEI